MEERDHDQGDDDVFFDKLQDSLMVTYSKSSFSLETNSTTTCGDTISMSERTSLFQRLLKDCPSKVSSGTLTDINPIFIILGRGTKKDSEKEVTMDEPLTKAFAIKLAVTHYYITFLVIMKLNAV